MPKYVNDPLCQFTRLFRCPALLLFDFYFCPTFCRYLRIAHVFEFCGVDLGEQFAASFEPDCCNYHVLNYSTFSHYVKTIIVYHYCITIFC